MNDYTTKMRAAVYLRAAKKQHAKRDSSADLFSCWTITKVEGIPCYSYSPARKEYEQMFDFLRFPADALAFWPEGVPSAQEINDVRVMCLLFAHEITRTGGL